MNQALLDRLKKPGPKRILSLDGGGIRGILTLGLLEELELVLQRQHNNPSLKLCDYFDLIGGTSTGSIIATGLALGMTASELKKHYFDLGNVIFGKKKRLVKFIMKGEKYDVGPLSDALQDVLGDITLGDQEKLKTGLCIVTKRADTFSTWPFTNHPEGKFYDQNKDIPLWKIVRASSAAPTYFLPLILDIGNGEKGAFIDGGISMANNPSLGLLMMATLRGFPYHWKIGAENILMVSLGTGSRAQKYDYKDFKNLSIMSWASMLPEHFMSDANYYNQLIMQILSDSPTAKEIDSEIGDLSMDHINGQTALSYVRYDVPFNQKNLERLGFSYSEKETKQLSAMDNPKNMDKLAEIGEKAAKLDIKPEHFSDHFALFQKPDIGLRRFTLNKKFDVAFDEYVKKRIPIQAVRIDEPFEVETLEGMMKGKSGDYLMKGVHGEYYVCDAAIFKETYEDADSNE
jgi:patatin-like phospholipase/acyl hydrolase